MNLFLLLALNCPTPLIENRSQYPWNKNDQWNLNTAIKNCSKFYPRSPCLKKLVKTGKQDYRAICGKNENN